MRAAANTAHAAYAELISPQVRVARPRELGDREISTWTRMQAADPNLASPFLAPGFALAVDSVRDDARVAVLEDAGQLVGFLAYQQGRFRSGRPIGATACDRQAVIAFPGASFDANIIMRGCGLATLEFDHLVASDTTFGAYSRVRCESYSMDLARGYDAYLSGRLTHSRKQLKRVFDKRERLATEAGDVEFEIHSQAAEHLTAMMSWKSAQFIRSGWPDRFRERWLHSLVELLFVGGQDGCRGMLSVLTAGHRPVACVYSLAGPANLATWFPAYDPEFGRFSPGLIVHLRLAEQAAADGFVEIDLGKGRQLYKDTLKTRDVELAEASAELPGPAALLRRLERAPREHVWGYVARHERLHRSARWALARWFSMRQHT
jgi:CelD/BcsL family acetyltransferase involved in cellulose biosynthesis